MLSLRNDTKMVGRLCNKIGRAGLAATLALFAGCETPGALNPKVTNVSGQPQGQYQLGSSQPQRKYQTANHAVTSVNLIPGKIDCWYWICNGWSDKDHDGTLSINELDGLKKEVFRKTEPINLGIFLFDRRGKLVLRVIDPDGNTELENGWAINRGSVLPNYQFNNLKKSGVYSVQWYFNNNLVRSFNLQITD